MGLRCCLSTDVVRYASRRENIPAIAIGSKTANLFILNRETGEPVFGVEERPVPKSDVAGEEVSPTQPFPVKPAPVSAQAMTANDAFGLDEEDRAWCRAEIGKLRAGSIFYAAIVAGNADAAGQYRRTTLGRDDLRP